MRTEYTLRLSAPLRGATLADPDQPLPPPQLSQVLPVPPAPEPPPPEPPPPPPPPPAGPTESEIALRLAEERARIEQALDQITSGVRDFIDRRGEERAEWRRAAIEVGVTLAARLIHDQIVAGDFPVETIVREMIGQVGGSGTVTVWLNPQDLALLQSRLGGKPLVEGEGVVQMSADPELARGDCRVESADDMVLSQLAEQLTEMRGRLLRSLGNAQY